MVRSGEALVSLLNEHGIPEKGGRIYLTACREGSQTASELARISGIDRVEAYRFIKQLEEKRLLHSTGGRPKRFAAVPLDELIERWIHRAAERLHHLERDKDKILTDWQEHTTSIDDNDTRKFAVLEGRSTIHRFIRKRIGTARREVLVSAAGFSLPNMMEGGLDRSLKEAAQRGVKVRIVTEVSAAHLADAKHFASFAELRHATTSVTNRSLVVDRQGALVFVSGEEGLGRSGNEQVALWSTEPLFIRLARDYHHRHWGPAVKADARFVELEAPDRTVLSLVDGGDNETIDRVREIMALGMRASGIRELKIDLPELIETVAQQLGRQVAEEMEGTTPSEVAQELAAYYPAHTMGRLTVVKENPLVLNVTGCFACTSESPEIGRVMCPKMLRTILETRLGNRWEVSKPDPTRHATKGCVFTASAA